MDLSVQTLRQSLTKNFPPKRCKPRRKSLVLARQLAGLRRSSGHMQFDRCIEVLFLYIVKQIKQSLVVSLEGLEFRIRLVNAFRVCVTLLVWVELKQSRLVVAFDTPKIRKLVQSITLTEP